jgi:hypothetical protein
MSPCELEVGWIALTLAVGVFVGACGGALAAKPFATGSIEKRRNAELGAEHGCAYDLDDAAERRQLEERLLRRNGGRP